MFVHEHDRLPHQIELGGDFHSVFDTFRDIKHGEGLGAHEPDG